MCHSRGQGQRPPSRGAGAGAQLERMGPAGPGSQHGACVDDPRPAWHPAYSWAGPSTAHHRHDLAAQGTFGTLPSGNRYRLKTTACQITSRVTVVRSYNACIHALVRTAANLNSKPCSLVCAGALKAPWGSPRQAAHRSRGRWCHQRVRAVADAALVFLGTYFSFHRLGG